MRRNSPSAAIPHGGVINPQNVGDFLLFAAQSSETIRAALVRSLVAPGIWFPTIPYISDRDLVTAIRVCSEASPRSLVNSPDYNRWLYLRNFLLVTTLSSQTRPPLLPTDIRRATKAILAVAQHFQVNSDNLEGQLSQFEQDHDVLKKAEEDLLKASVSKRLRAKRLAQLRRDLMGKTKRTPHRGRRFNEHDHRKLAAIMLLVHLKTGKSKAYEQVARALFDWGITLEAESLRSLETRYQKTCRPRKLGSLQSPKKLRAARVDPEAVVWTGSGRPDAFIILENLPRFWLEKMGWFLLDQRTQTNPPEFIAQLLSSALKAELEQAKRGFLALSGPPVP